MGLNLRTFKSFVSLKSKFSCNELSHFYETVNKNILMFQTKKKLGKLGEEVHRVKCSYKKTCIQQIGLEARCYNCECV